MAAAPTTPAKEWSLDDLAAIPNPDDDARVVAARAVELRFSKTLAQVEEEFPRLVECGASEWDRAQNRATARKLLQQREDARVALDRVRNTVCHEIAEQLFPAYRERVRVAVGAYLEFVRVRAALAELDSHLWERGLSVAPLQHDVPRVDELPPSDPDADSARVIRQLIDGGFLSPREDAALITGFAVDLPTPPPPAAAPPPTPKSAKRRFLGL